MPNPTDGGLPEGGDQSFSDLSDRIQALNRQERRRTIFRLSQMFEEDLKEESGELHSTLRSSLGAEAGNLGANGGTATTQVIIDHADKKLPRFSGSSKVSQGEVNYRRWQRDATRLVDDSGISEEQKKRALFKSLQGQADDIAELHRDTSALQLLDILDKQYGGTIDGDELLVDFYNIVQTSNQSASEYLSHLFIELGEVVKYEGVGVAQMPKVLLKQFIRGTTDEEILLKLRLEEKISNPPQFPDFISSIRREESKRTERRLRLKKQARAQATTVADPRQDEVTMLQQRVRDLEAMVAGKGASTETSKPQQSSELSQVQQRVARLEQRVGQVRNKYIFCYRCGEDAHLASDCKNLPNKKLVQEKVDARRKHKQQLN